MFSCVYNSPTFGVKIQWWT